MFGGIRGKFPFTFNSPFSFIRWNRSLFHDSMRDDDNVSAAEEVQDPVIDAVQRRAQFIDSVLQKIGHGSPEFVTLGFELAQVDEHFSLRLYVNEF